MGLNVVISLRPLFQTLICHHLFQNKANLICVLNSGWPLNRGKDIRKTSLGGPKWWLQLLNRDGWGNGGFIYSILMTIISGL